MRWKVRVPRMPRVSWRVLGWAGAAMAVMVLWMTAPLALRRLEFFRVRQVELVGIRYLDADRVLSALQLPARASVFDDTDVLAGRLRALDGIADVAVSRRLPGSLKVTVREIEPIALVMNDHGALQPVDAAGRALPFDLATLDLPVVQSRDSGVVSVLARVQAFDPVLYQSIDAARRAPGGAGAAGAAGAAGGGPRGTVVLELGPHRVLLNSDAGPEVIQAVVLVARDLAAKARPYAELDARFAGQIVVRRRSSGGGSV